MRHLLIALGLALVSIAAVYGGTVAAQSPTATVIATPAVSPTPPPPGVMPVPQAITRSGDILWTFAQEPPFNDPRVATAFAALMQGMNRALQSSAGVFYAAPGPASAPLVLAGPPPLDQVPLLLQAAGFRGADWHEIGRCRIWVAPSPVGVTPIAPPERVAEQINKALTEALAMYRISKQICERTTNTAEAHLLVWVEGGPPPIVPSRQQPTFLTGPSVPAAQPAGRGGDVPLPARTGSGGVDGASGVAIVFGITLIVVAASSSMMRRRPL